MSGERWCIGRFVKSGEGSEKLRADRKTCRVSRRDEEFEVRVLHGHRLFPGLVHRPCLRWRACGTPACGSTIGTRARVIGTTRYSGGTNCLHLRGPRVPTNGHRGAHTIPNFGSFHNVNSPPFPANFAARSCPLLRSLALIEGGFGGRPSTLPTRASTTRNSSFISRVCRGPPRPDGCSFGGRSGASFRRFSRLSYRLNRSSQAQSEQRPKLALSSYGLSRYRPDLGFPRPRKVQDGVLPPQFGPRGICLEGFARPDLPSPTNVAKGGRRC